MHLQSSPSSRSASGLPGFTLVEVLVSTGILAMVCISLYAGISWSFSSLENARHRLRATQILAEKLEVIRLYNWDQVNSPGFVPATFTDHYRPEGSPNPGIAYHGTVSIIEAPVQPAYTNTMRMAVVQLQWVSGGIAQQQRLETLISQYGVQNYIY
jgi:hypothetical protein